MRIKKSGTKGYSCMIGARHCDSDCSVCEYGMKKSPRRKK